MAERWETSPDGLTWTFFLRKDVKFQDGTPLTANDYVYTFERAVDPATASPVTGTQLATVAKTEAPDDYTFKVTLKEPYFPFLDNLAAPGTMQPLSKAWVEKYGEDYGRHPMSVGPYKLKEWVTGDHITLERNPDYAWQPPYAHQGPRYIQEFVIRIIPEVATVVAAFEAGELDYSALDAQYIDGSRRPAISTSSNHTRTKRCLLFPSTSPSRLSTTSKFARRSTWRSTASR